uniref:DUF2753 family protein n=1 Tax=Thaumasiovibrio occultus TaxID=1891184 RepID=UPI000B34BCEF|nr:DUF2753 family protein [Thaumasiovibrio occultus]
MDTGRWEAHTLRAIDEEQQGHLMMSVVHYQLALAEAQHLAPKLDNDSLEELLTIRVASCHNLANFWRKIDEQDEELKYLQLAADQVLNLLPQCPNTQCKTFVASLGCCKAALVHFLKRHPNPAIAKQVEHLNYYSDCEMIARFQLN